MKKLALIAAAIGIFVALAAFMACENGIIGVKTFFKLGFAGLGLMILSSVYFLFSCIHEWARETDFFKRKLSVTQDFLLQD